jgi:hypothetical protein
MAVNESTMESAWRAPTTEEAKVLKENTQLYKSNEFRLKVRNKFFRLNTRAHKRLG